MSSISTTSSQLSSQDLSLDSTTTAGLGSNFDEKLDAAERELARLRVELVLFQNNLDLESGKE